MKIEKSLYPKTKRYSESSAQVTITEKMDGSNLAIFKKEGEICIAQRKNIMTVDEDAISNYKGLRPWLDENLSKLDLCEGSCICGEWMGMGKLNYPNVESNRFYMFAKANITEDFGLKNLLYTHEHFKYCFESQEIPDCINLVPTVAFLSAYPTLEQLNEWYKEYSYSLGRDVEGFVLHQNGVIRKYVRRKNGRLTDHQETVGRP